MEAEPDGLASKGDERSRARRWLRPRLTIRRGMAAVALVAIVLGLGKLLFIDNRPLDIPAWAISSLAGHFTVYAEGYSESRYRSIRPGMTPRQVEDILGEPLNKEDWDNGPMWPGSTEAWNYSDPGRLDGNFWRREIWFNNGQVTMKVSNYWWHILPYR